MQTWASPLHEESRLRLFTDLADSNELAITDQTGDAIDGVQPVVCAYLRLQDPEFVNNPRSISLKDWEEIGSTMDLANFFSYQNLSDSPGSCQKTCQLTTCAQTQPSNLEDRFSSGSLHRIT